ncbi:hypothetical protein JCM8097_001715 [Rhodosporidiobolus ruineniae]
MLAAALRRSTALRAPLTRSTRPLATQAATTVKPDPNLKVTTLPNGIRVASDPTPGHFVAAGVYVDAGSRYESARTRGAAHMTDRLAFKSTANRTADQITTEIEQLGGQFISSSSRETILYQATTYTESLPSVLSILSDTVLNPSVLPEELDIQRDAALWEVGEIKTKPEMILPELLHETAFQGNTLGNPLLCPEERLETMTPEVIKDFMGMWYRPERLVVAAAGVEHEQLVELAERHFGHVKPSSPSLSSSASTSPSSRLSASPSANFSTSAPSSASVLSPSSSSLAPEESYDYLATAPARYTGGTLLLENPDLEFTHVYVGFEGLPIHDEDIYALATLQVLLGGGGSFSAGGPGKGMYSRLYTQVLNQYHAVDFCSSFHHCYLDSGLFGLSISVHPSFLPRVPDLIAHQLDCVTRPMPGGVGEPELARARNQLKSSLAMALESRMVQVEDLGRQVQVHGRKVSMPEMAALIDSVTLSDLYRVASRVLRPSASPIVGDRERSGKPTVVAQGQVGRLPDVVEALRRRGLAGIMQTFLLRRRLAYDPSLLLAVPASPSPSPASSGSAQLAAPHGAVREAATGGEGAVGMDEKGRAGKHEAKEDDGERVMLVEFGEDDPLDPKTWSLSYRWFLTLLISHTSLLVGQASAINSAAVPYMAEYLGVSEEAALLDTALFLVGFGVGAPFVGSLSELGGRNPVILVTLALFMLFEVGAALAPNLAARAVLRFFAGCAGAAPISNAGGSLADLWTPTERAFAFPVFSLSAWLGPVFAPVLGGYIGEYYDYRWCDWVSAIWAALGLVITLFFMPETYPPTILQMKAAALRSKTGDKRYRTALEELRQTVSFKQHFLETVKRPFCLLVFEPIVLLFSLYMTLVYIVVFGDLVAYSYIFKQPYSLSDGTVGLTFLAPVVGLFLGTAFTPLLYRRHLAATSRARALGRPTQPEEHLRPAIVATWLVPVALLLAGWTSRESIPIWVPLASQVLFGLGILLIYIAICQYIIDAYLSYAASALGVLTLVRYPVAGAATLFTGPMYNSLGRHWAMTLLAVLAVLVSFIPVVFFLYGLRIRSWSRYAPKIAL